MNCSCHGGQYVSTVLHLEPVISVYTTYIHGIYHAYVDGISMDIPYHVYPHSIYMVYPWIYMDIHGISFDVYTWYICGISMDIPGYSFLKPDFAACPCCWSHSMCTRVWVIKSVLFHAPPWQLCQGKRLPTKGPTLLPPTFPLCCLQQQ
jgi:hypothetical protein